jgi:hypothetical protein
MRHLRVVALIAFMSTSAWVFAQDAATDSAKAPVDPGKPAVTVPATPSIGQATAPELVVAGKKDGNKPDAFRLRLGDTLVMNATGALAEKIAAEFAKSSESRALTLYLDGVRMTGLPSRPLDLVPGGPVRFGFDLVREANTDDNRKAWDALLRGKSKNSDMTLHASVAVGSDPPRSAHSPQPLRFYVAETATIYGVSVAAILLFLGLYVILVKRTGMLRDAETGFYSLGKSQMAFWGLLVLLSFFGVWVLTGTMERISPQALMLLGISGATGLAAIFIGGDSKQKMDQTILEIKTRLPELEKDKADLESRKKSGVALTPADEARRLSIQAEITTLKKQLQALTPKNFFYDIVNDGNGISFHRAQVVAWTIILGFVFVGAVMQVMSMPEFPESLLALMGISNATYLGFKIPEKSGT